MGLLRRSPTASLTVTPTTLSPRETVTATVTTTGAIDKVTTATLDWGYTNFYRYHWAGRLDSAGNASDDLLMLGEPGTNYGGDRNADDWVSVTTVDLPIATSEFTGGSAQFRIPSWAPASSPEIARWGCRLGIRRAGRDLDERAEFTVLVRAADVDAGPEPLEHYDGTHDTAVDIDLPAAVFAAGAVIRGHISLHPGSDLPDGDLRVFWQRHRESHPLRRRPCETAPVNGPVLKLGNHIPLRAGCPMTIPFELPLPADAAPTASAVHSSMSWFVAAELFYAGFTGHLTERFRRPIVVVNA